MSDAGATALGITGRSTAALDISFLGLLVAICAAPYILGLGFYYDDWAFLASLTVDPDQSFLGLLSYFGSIENIAPRPCRRSNSLACTSFLASIRRPATSSITLFSGRPSVFCIWRHAG